MPILLQSSILLMMFSVLKKFFAGKKRRCELHGRKIWTPIRSCSFVMFKL